MCFSAFHTAEWLKWSQGLNCVTHISNPASSSNLKCYFYTFFLRKSYVAQTDLELVTSNLNFWSSFLYFLHPGIKVWTTMPRLCNGLADRIQGFVHAGQALCLLVEREKKWEYVSLHVWLPTYHNMEIRRQLLALVFSFHEGTEDWAWVTA